MVNAIKFVLQMLGLAVVIWFIWIAGEEYMKLKRKENGNGQPHGQ